MTAAEKLQDLALSLGANARAATDAAGITYRREFRAACEQNACGKYGGCWMCPPDCGDIDVMIAKAKGYGRAFVFQTVSPLEDSFDIEGMQKAAGNHAALTLTLKRAAEAELDSPLTLGAGGCHVCGVCAKVTGEPCRCPGKAFASLEAYGIDVTELAKLCGMNYINGQNTVTYFGVVLFNEP